MAGADYWDDKGTGTRSWSGTNSSTDTSTYGGNWYWTNQYYQPVAYTPRKILVHNPDHWTEEQAMKFIELVNIKTKTGYIATLFIKGEVLITDPDVEKREMKDFVPLLRKRASVTELEIINKFFEENPCEL